MASENIAILFHESLEPERMPAYRIWHLAEAWRRQGHVVRFLTAPDEVGANDFLIPQVDLSVMPEEYRRALQRAGCVINRRVTSILKSTFSEIRLDLGTATQHHGPAIVKTNLNYGGKPELRLAASANTPLGPATANGAFASYHVFDRSSDVPPSVFSDPWFIVERFLPEFDGTHYYVRSYSFLGHQSVTIRLQSTNPIVKSANASSWEQVDVHPEIVRARERLGFDYGKFDYVVQDGVSILLDINSTPTFHRSGHARRVRLLTRTLAEGLTAWIQPQRL